MKEHDTLTELLASKLGPEKARMYVSTLLALEAIVIKLKLPEHQLEEYKDYIVTALTDHNINSLVYIEFEQELWRTMGQILPYIGLVARAAVSPGLLTISQFASGLATITDYNREAGAEVMDAFRLSDWSIEYTLGEVINKISELTAFQCSNIIEASPLFIEKLEECYNEALGEDYYDE
jgi:hypothetical protein